MLNYMPIVTIYILELQVNVVVVIVIVIVVVVPHKRYVSLQQCYQYSH